MCRHKQILICARFALGPSQSSGGDHAEMQDTRKVRFAKLVASWKTLVKSVFHTLTLVCQFRFVILHSVSTQMMPFQRVMWTGNTSQRNMIVGYVISCLFSYLFLSNDKWFKIMLHLLMWGCWCLCIMHPCVFNTISTTHAVLQICAPFL